MLLAWLVAVVASLDALSIRFVKNHDSSLRFCDVKNQQFQENQFVVHFDIFSVKVLR